MIPSELAKKIRYIQIYTSKAVNDGLAGEYESLFKGRGMELIYFIQAPILIERFQANVVAAMQKKKILGVTTKHVIIAKHRL